MIEVGSVVGSAEWAYRMAKATSSKHWNGKDSEGRIQKLWIQKPGVRSLGFRSQDSEA